MLTWCVFFFFFEEPCGCHWAQLLFYGSRSPGFLSLRAGATGTHADIWLLLLLLLLLLSFFFFFFFYCFFFFYLFFFFSSSIFLLLSYASFHPSHVHIRMQVLQCSFHLLPTSSAPLAKHKDHLFDSLCFSRLKLAPPQWWGACSVVTFAFTSITHKRTASGVGRRFRPRDQRTVDRWTPLLCVRRFSFLAQNVRRSFTGAICGCHVVWRRGQAASGSAVSRTILSLTLQSSGGHLCFHYASFQLFCVVRFECCSPFLLSRADKVRSLSELSQYAFTELSLTWCSPADMRLAFCTRRRLP